MVIVFRDSTTLTHSSTDSSGCSMVEPRVEWKTVQAYHCVAVLMEEIDKVMAIGIVIRKNVRRSWKISRTRIVE